MQPRRATLSFRTAQWGAMSHREILISGRTLAAWLAATTGSAPPMIATSLSPIPWRPCSNPAEPAHARLLPEGPADFPCGRRALLVCRECADFGCGALTVRIRSVDDWVVWDQWLWQNDYDPESSDDFGGQMPAFRFDDKMYRAQVARSPSML